MTDSTPRETHCETDTFDYTWTFKALTPIWTGNDEGKGDKLILTGLLGSLRWWFEVLVRGLGGSACDPTPAGNPCPARTVRNATDPGHHCVVCELFGCTGWARKFRFQVLYGNENIQSDQIKKGQCFKLRFIPIRAIREEEWALLHLTLRLISCYGAIGGKITLKPLRICSKAPGRDYGLVQLKEGPNFGSSANREKLERYVREDRWRKVDHRRFEWASLENFWCVKNKYIARQDQNSSTFNQVLGRKESREQAEELSDEGAASEWLAGKRGESKKVFSFKEPPDARRTFGFVKPGTVSFEDMKGRLEKVWGVLNDSEFLTGDKILEALFQK